MVIRHHAPCFTSFSFQSDHSSHVPQTQLCLNEVYNNVAKCSNENLYLPPHSKAHFERKYHDINHNYDPQACLHLLLSTMTSKLMSSA
jgi:hypothetical protein